MPISSMRKGFVSSVFALIISIIFTTLCTDENENAKMDISSDDIQLLDAIDRGDTISDLNETDTKEYIDSDGDGLPDRREEIIGTDPFNPDTDFDGISDYDELKEKTDPLNPASASKWHPELNISPRLFFDKDDQENIRTHIKSRISGKAEPYATIYNRILNIADRVPSEYRESFDTRISSQNGEIAEASAFLGWLNGDETYLNKALNIIAMKFPDPTGVSLEEKYNLYESEALTSLCTAYEYLSSTTNIDTSLLSSARDNLIMRLNYFREITHNGTYAVSLAYLNNNHKIKVLSALGLCAMLLNDRREAAFEISSAMSGIDFLMSDFQNAEGFYAEGWSYLNYTGNSFLPFMYAYHRYARGKSIPYYGVENISGGSPHTGKVVQIQDFVTNPKIERLYKMALFSTQPNGLMNPIDDANPECLHGSILYKIFNNPDFLWQWYKPDCNFNTNRLNTLSLLLLTDDKAPEIPTTIGLEASEIEGGVAIMRSGFDANSTYLAFIGEHQKARTNGLGHEHPDELSFILWAYSTPLVIDPGYINWENHNYTKYAKDHSVILIDGEGAPYDDIRNRIGADVYLSDISYDGRVSYVSGLTSYLDSEIKRSVIRINDRYFVLLDRVKFKDNNPHEVTVQINGMGGGDIPDSKLTITDNLARYEKEDVILDISLLTDGENLSLYSRKEEYAKVWGVWGYNDMLLGRASAADSISFLTLLLPQKSKDGILMDSRRLSDKLFYNHFQDAEFDYIIALNKNETPQEIDTANVKIQIQSGLSIVILQTNKEVQRTLIEP